MNEISLDVAIVKDLKNIDFFKIEYDPDNFSKGALIKARLTLERLKIINMLKKLKKEGKIKYINIPKNKTMVKELKNLVRAKRNISKSLNILNKLE